MGRKKQHRKGRKISRKLANLEAISQTVTEEPKFHCPGCYAKITLADFDAGQCTQCKTKIQEAA